MNNHGFTTSELLAMLAACMVFILLLIGSFSSTNTETAKSDVSLKDAYQNTQKAF